MNAGQLLQFAMTILILIPLASCGRGGARPDARAHGSVNRHPTQEFPEVYVFAIEQQASPVQYAFFPCALNMALPMESLPRYVSIDAMASAIAHQGTAGSTVTVISDITPDSPRYGLRLRRLHAAERQALQRALAGCGIAF